MGAMRVAVKIKHTDVLYRYDHERHDDDNSERAESW